VTNNFPFLSEIHSNPDTDVIQWQVITIMNEQQKKDGTFTRKRHAEIWQKLSLEVERKGTSEEMALAYLVDKQIQFQINATMSRIRELDGMDQNQ
jgi:hypothetical protein